MRLGNALGKNTHLVELLMANCVIKEAGAVAVAKGLETNTSITVVNLESNRSVPAAARRGEACERHTDPQPVFFLGRAHVQHRRAGHGCHC